MTRRVHTTTTVWASEREYSTWKREENVRLSVLHKMFIPISDRPCPDESYRNTTGPTPEPGRRSQENDDVPGPSSRPDDTWPRRKRNFDMVPKTRDVRARDVPTRFWREHDWMDLRRENSQHSTFSHLSRACAEFRYRDNYFSKRLSVWI